MVRPVVEDILRVDGLDYVLATSALAEGNQRVLKEGETFAVFDRHGDILPFGLQEQGLYHHDTRYLSRLEMRLNDHKPLFLSSNVKSNSAILVVDLSNPPLMEPHEMERGIIHLTAHTLLQDGSLHRRILVTNYCWNPARIHLSLHFEADFVDLFEVRGTGRNERGELRTPTSLEDGFVFGYRGLDGLERTTTIRLSPRPARLEGQSSHYEFVLEQHEAAVVELTAVCGTAREHIRVRTFDETLTVSEERMIERKRLFAEVETDNQRLNDWLNRSRDDLCLLVTPTPHGYYPYAGIPWYSTIFGRDGLLTALELLWSAPQIARGVLSYLARHQADEDDPRNDAEPGKILHEQRLGEMAILNEIPFRRYYGSVDATPLFVYLAAEYFRRTDDHDFLRSILPNIEKALRWIDTHGDADGDGFIEYSRRTEKGLKNQGWKDSFDSIFHADGQLATGSVALTEVQGYVYAAKRGIAQVFEILGDSNKATRLHGEAERLRREFEEKFWCDEIRSYGLGLDGEKKILRVRSSNAGQALMTGIVDRVRARAMSESLMSDDLFSGWGIRTVARGEARYNPMAYHNGSVWPHDNALIARGLSYYGFKREAARIFEGLFAASLSMDLQRMPELFCGFARRPENGPTRYPVACIPQAWAAAGAHSLLQSILGMQVDAISGRLIFDRPFVPGFIREITIRRLAVNSGEIDLRIVRHAHDVSVEVLERRCEIEVLVVK